jgi:CRP-like cAMP-binding protein
MQNSVLDESALWSRSLTLASLHLEAASTEDPVTIPVDTVLSERATFIANSALFAGLTKSDCTQIAQYARIREYPRSTFVFERGQPLRHVVLVVSGCVKLTQLSYSGSEVILWLLGPGAAVGIFGMPSQAKHTCCIRTMASCRALSWEWSKIERLPVISHIKDNIARITSERITELEERFREIATEKVQIRVAFALLRIAKQVGRPCHEGVEVLLSREELAQLTGTTLFTISRLMSQWSDSGIIEPRREAILIRDAVKLLRTCSEDN